MRIEACASTAHPLVLQNSSPKPNPTSQKTHDLVIKKVLPLVAAVFAAAAVVCAFLVTPLWMALAVPLSIYAIMGIERLLQAKGPVGPVGLPNQGNNCWLNAAIQLVSNAPSLKMKMSRNALLGMVFKKCQEARDLGNSVAERANTQMIRNHLHKATGGAVSSLPTQEDPSAFFEHFFSGRSSNARPLFSFLQTINGEFSNMRDEPYISLEMGAGGFSKMMDRYFETTESTGQRLKLTFENPPQDLLVQLRRFRRDANGNRKLDDAVAVPLEYTLPASRNLNGKPQVYECRGFVEHRGTIDGGHYVAYVKKEDTWWCCDDHRVFPVSLEHVQSHMNNSYFYHFHAKEPEEVIKA